MNRDEEIFFDALQLPDDQRPRFLARACDGDTGLRSRVEALLRAHERGRGFLPGAAVLAATEARGEAAGEQIGAYRLQRRIGEGGCGVVWLAEQGEPLRRQVALKVIKVGMDTREVISRFEAERQALAMMDHPNIARVFDAGVTASGRSYFVMEYVPGVRITDFCDHQDLDMRQRLALFTQVCRAIQHAHQKGIIHRDIKPSNVLVALEDGVPVPKVIDFGIAKATQGRLTDHPFETALGQLVGTPAYMSPEQTDPARADIDTRSDVYSLGVLLYELLAGRPPFDPRTLAEAGFDEMRRILREKEPPRPSTRLNTLGHADRAVIAHHRGTEPQQLARLISGDLDWIVMRCLEKNRARRYESASELARDVERHLHDEPVSARPPSKLYRLRKLAMRNKAVFASMATATTLLVMVAIGASVVAWQARQAEWAIEQQASRTDIALGSRLLEERKFGEGIAFMVRAARSDPGNLSIGPRLVSALAYRSIVMPLGRPLVHQNLLRDGRYSPDGQRLATVTSDEMRIWDLASGRLERAMKSVLTTVSARDIVGHFGPDFRHVATGGDSGLVRVYDFQAGQVVAPLMPHPGSITRILYSPDGRWVASCSRRDGLVKIWDSASHALLSTIEMGMPAGWEALAFDPAGNRLLVVTMQTAWGVWKVPGGGPVFTRKDDPSVQLSGVGSFSPDGKLVAIADTRGAQLYDAETGELVGPRMEHPAGCSGMVFSRDGKALATKSPDTLVRFWRLSAMEKTTWELPHTGAVVEFDFTPNDRQLLTQAADGTVRLWDLATGELAADPLRFSAQRLYVSPDGSEFTTFSRGDLVARRWSTAIGKFTPLTLPPDPDRLAVCGDGSGAAVFAVYSDRIQRLKLPSGTPDGPPLRLPAKLFINRGMPAMAWSPDGSKMLTKLGAADVRGAADGPTCYDLSGPEVVGHPLAGVESSVTGTSGQHGSALAWFSTDSRRLAVHYHPRGDCRIGVWDAQTRRRLAGDLEDVATDSLGEISPDGRWLAFARKDHDVVVWDLASNRQHGPALRTRVVPVVALRFSPDSRLLAVGNFGMEVQAWQIETGTPVGPPLLHRWPIRDLAFFRDSRRLVTLTGHETRIWDATSGTPLSPPMIQPIVPNDTLARMALSPDESLLATFTIGGNVRIYDTATGQLQIEPIQAGGRVWPLWGGCGFDASGRFITVAKAGGGFSVWPLPPLSVREPVPDWMLRLATSMAGGSLDRFSAFREQPVEAAVLDAIREELERLPADAPYVEWGRWILADPATRPCAPGLGQPH